jgi:hypothetical protein
MPANTKANRESHASRLNQLDFHWENAFIALSGWPRWKVDDKRPPMAKLKPIAKKTNPTRPLIFGYPRHRKANSPKPNPDRVVKIITDGAGCILNSV